MIFKYDATGQREVRQEFTGDINFNLRGDPAVRDETVSVVGPWSDFTGSATVPSREQQQWGGHGNTLQGTDAAIKGARLSQLGIVGQRIGTTRRRVQKINRDFLDGRRN